MEGHIGFERTRLDHLALAERIQKGKNHHKCPDISQIAAHPNQSEAVQYQVNAKRKQDHQAIPEGKGQDVFEQHGRSHGNLRRLDQARQAQ